MPRKRKYEGIDQSELIALAEHVTSSLEEFQEQPKWMWDELIKVAGLGDLAEYLVLQIEGDVVRVSTGLWLAIIARAKRAPQPRRGKPPMSQRRKMWLREAAGEALEIKRQLLEEEKARRKRLGRRTSEQPLLTTKDAPRQAVAFRGIITQITP
jgi:hypothetical protein